MGARAEQLDFGGSQVEVGEDPEAPGGLVCFRCQELKPVSEFHRNPVSKTGRQSNCKSCMAVYSRRSMLGKRYGITEEQYEEMLAEQEGRCGACGTDDPGAKHGRFQVDHDHQTGAVRALLCNGCNTALGGVKDSIPRLQELIYYLRQYAV